MVYNLDIKYKPLHYLKNTYILNGYLNNSHHYKTLFSVVDT